MIAQEVGARGDLRDCWFTFDCLLAEFLSAGVGRGFDCVPPPPGGLAGATTLSRYRNEVLAATPEGQYYTHLYEQHSLDMIRATVADPSIFARALNGEVAWITALQALVDGNGAAATVTPQMQADLSAILDAFTAHGSPALGNVVSTERARLQLDSISGLNMNQFQGQIETLGGVSAMEPRSWGQIKSQYR